MDFSLFQEHTVKLYDLEHRSYQIQTIKARALLSVYRFDLFAKLIYARKRKTDCQFARDIYIKHIKAFNPDGREPGRDDKISLEDFLRVYDNLLDYFEEADFDATKSIVPVSSDGVILDGAHRVAALAYYDKEVTIAKFEEVTPVCQFDYNYFLQRGLSREVCDLIAREIVQWVPNCFVACFWPRMGSLDQKAAAQKVLNRRSLPFYHKSISVNLKSLTLFMAKVYRMQAWVGSEDNQFAGAKDKALNCYSKGNRLDLFFFSSDLSLDDILNMKEQIRKLYPYGKHSVHITDNDEETKDIAYFALTKQGQEQWTFAGNWRGWELIKQSFAERIYIFKHVTWINAKVWVASCINRLRGC